MTSRFKDKTRARYRQESSWQTVLFSTALSILLLATVGFLLISSWRVTRQRAELSEKLRGLKAEVTALEQRNKELKAEAPQTQSPEFLEKKIREQGYKKPGEEVAVVMRAETSASENEKSVGFWANLFGKIKFW